MWKWVNVHPRRTLQTGRGVVMHAPAPTPRPTAALGLRQDDGFTLLELIVAVVIIGVLTAIAIPIFTGQQQSSKVAAAKADLVNFKTAYMSYAIANGGSFKIALSGYKPAPGILDRYGWTGGSPGTDLLLQPGDASFCADVIGADGAVGWSITPSTGPTNKWCP